MPERPRVAPTEISMPPVMITNVSPKANRIVSVESCRMLLMLSTPRKPGLRTSNIATMTIRPAIKQATAGAASGDAPASLPRLAL